MAHKYMDVVCGIIEMQGGYVIARRGKGVHENIWEFPGGKVEEGETQREALLREIKEELEIDVDVVQFVKTIVDDRREEVIFVSAYLCRYHSGEIQLHAHHEYRIVAREELFSYSFEEADKGILEALFVL